MEGGQSAEVGYRVEHCRLAKLGIRGPEDNGTDAGEMEKAQVTAQQHGRAKASNNGRRPVVWVETGSVMGLARKEANGDGGAKVG